MAGGGGMTGCFKAESSGKSYHKKKMSKEEKALRKDLRKSITQYIFYEKITKMDFDFYTEDEVRWFFDYIDECSYLVKNIFLQEDDDGNLLQPWSMIEEFSQYKDKNVQFKDSIDFIYKLVGIRFSLTSDNSWIVKDINDETGKTFTLNMYYNRHPKYPEECILTPDKCRLQDINYKVSDDQKLRAEHFFREHKKCECGYDYIMSPMTIYSDLVIKCRGCGKTIQLGNS